MPSVAQIPEAGLQRAQLLDLQLSRILDRPRQFFAEIAHELDLQSQSVQFERRIGFATQGFEQAPATFLELPPRQGLDAARWGAAANGIARHDTQLLDPLAPCSGIQVPFQFARSAVPLAAAQRP